MDNTNKYYIKTSSGQMIGPFSSQETAETQRLNEGIQGTVVAGTGDRKEILMG